MAPLKGFSVTDRKFLRSIKIDPEPTSEEIVIDALSEPTQYIPDAVVVTAELARKVRQEFGSLTVQNVWAYLKKYQA